MTASEIFHKIYSKVSKVSNPSLFYELNNNE